MYPENDDEFEDVGIKEVEKSNGDGWAIKRSDGWLFFVPPESPVEPKPGMMARFYGKGIGYDVRGLFLDGQRVFYRTEVEQKEKNEIDLYGANATDWLKRWDKGDTVWTIEMGGLGPGYEQCIHITAAEILRIMLQNKYDHTKWGTEEAWKHDIDEIEREVFKVPVVEKLGLSGAQWGAAVNVAANLYRRGPPVALTDKAIKDRMIQVSRTFPTA